MDMLSSQELLSTSWVANILNGSSSLQSNQTKSWRIRQTVLLHRIATAGKVSTFLQVCTGKPFLYEYGLTEAGSGNVCNLRLADCAPGTVGGLFPNVELKILPLDDYHDPNAGELLLGGRCNCQKRIGDMNLQVFLEANEKFTLINSYCT